MEQNEVIDLTQSFTYCRAPIILNSEVIDLDDSIYDSPRPASLTIPIGIENINIENETEAIGLIMAMNANQRQTRNSTGIKKKKRPKKPKFGDCPICREPLGTRPMSSTKCGHVYCISCIEEAVKIEKRCPTCRQPLKGVTAYHPLFL